MSRIREYDKSVFRRNTREQYGWSMCWETVKFIFNRFYFINEIQATLKYTIDGLEEIKYECYFNEFKDVNCFKFDEHIIYGIYKKDKVISMLDNLKLEIENDKLKNLYIKIEFKEG